MSELVGVAWLSAGFSFWMAMVIYNGPPNTWRSYPRVEGWSTLLFFYLPFCLAAGPVNWGLFWWARRAA